MKNELEGFKALAQALPPTGVKARTPIIKAAKKIEEAISRAVQERHPGLTGFLLPAPCSYRWDAEKDGWVAWRSNSQFRRAAINWADKVMHVASSRISEAYGLGGGTAWLQEVGAAEDETCEELAASQVLTSIASCNPHAVALGRLGGQAKSQAKTDAARENAKKGGRPRKKYQAIYYAADGDQGCPEELLIAGDLKSCRAAIREALGVRNLCGRKWEGTGRDIEAYHEYPASHEKGETCGGYAITSCDDEEGTEEDTEYPFGYA